ncbi:hypothetical protein NJB1907f44_37430 [Mycobacterium marinum]|nr:transposase [Mycobacterium marinum]GJN99923.1 hypothetical protein NJB1907f34b_14180 [Mycobacterium marinum]GJO06410.1 hypothetical protein NJB1808e29_35560 [Mycobacterium marinum]GJO14316.1 hypothetical protein NJB1907E90_39390 [Mycobacterium marinum]GJO24482.1 hypothetical protein NJB1907E11_37990 [Mycobacterium marinum]GJO24956.1 hypothetical protein NJB1728e18_31130 [Mycobacterium marinum]
MAGSALKKPKKRRIVGGVDTHGDTHHAAVVLLNGTRVADAEFEATAAGYALLAWLRSFGRLSAVGVEGTGAYGAGLARHLAAEGVRIVEVNRPDRRQRRIKGKSDPLDAYAAAEAVLSERAIGTKKIGTGIVESIRAPHTTRAGAVKARTAAMNELRTLLITAPADLRDKLRGLAPAALVAACARLRPTGEATDPQTAVRAAPRSLARRHQALTAEIADLDEALNPLVEQACPALIAIKGGVCCTDR